MQCVYKGMSAMSKLKRKKLSVEESKTEQQTRIKKSIKDSKKSVQDRSCATTSTGSREKWWESSDLSDVEKLWALTLRALCPNLQSDDLEESIPQLPPPSSSKTPVHALNDWGSCNADKDANPPPGLPVPSFLLHPPPANDLKNISQHPVEENTGKSDPPSLTDQESVSVCAIQIAQKRHLDDEEKCIEDLELPDEQSDRFGQARNVPEMRTNEAELRTAGSGAGKVAETGAGQPESEIETISGAEGSGSVLGTKCEASRAGSVQRAKSGADQWEKFGVRGSGTKSGIEKEAKQGLGRSGSGLERNSIASGSGLVLGTKSGASGSGLGVGKKIGASGSRQSLGMKSGASGPGLGLWTTSIARSGQGTKCVASGSGLGLGTNSEASGIGLGLETKSATRQELKTGLRGFESGLGTNAGASGSGLGLGTKSVTGYEAKSGLKGSGLGPGMTSGEGKRAKSGLGGSGSGLGTSSGAGLETTISPEESGSGLETKSRAESSSGLECCPMCLMPFPAGFTQMECDGHLAQCLSEMQDDIIW